MWKKQLRIISGGQTGVDRAALDFALHYGISCGGYCPKGRKAEDGPIPDIYPLKELLSERYSDRTKRNIEVSDGTLIFKTGSGLDRGTNLTLEYCKKQNKPCFIYSLAKDQVNPYEDLYKWIENHGIVTVPYRASFAKKSKNLTGKVLNIAGNRESFSPGIYRLVYETLVRFYHDYLS